MRISLLNVPCLAGVALTSGIAAANGGDIVILAATGSTTICIATDVQTRLAGSGMFGLVDLVDVGTSTPTLSSLLQYDAVLVYTRVGFQDAVLLGDTLADYVDAGGGVVVAESAIGGANPATLLAGRWQTGGYEVIPTSSGIANTPAALGTVAQPGHPIMAGVTTFSATLALRNLATSVLQGSVVAYWDDGSVLVAVGGTHPRRVDLGFYPPSSQCIATYWDASATDGVQLMVNALCFAASPPSVGTNYCNAVPNSTQSAAAMAGTGSNSLASNDFGLLAANLPVGAFGYFLTSQTQGFVANPGGSQGNLCLGGGIGRFVAPGQIQLSDANGEIRLAVDLLLHPTPAGLAAVNAGETWNYTAWYRDSNPGITSNFADGLSVQFQ